MAGTEPNQERNSTGRGGSTSDRPPRKGKKETRGRKKITVMTPAQKEIFLVIDEFWKKYGFAPSVKDVMYITGEKGAGNVSRKMRRLIDLGICKGIKGKQRTIRPAGLRVRTIE